MRIPRLGFCLLALAVSNLLGCSQTSWLRSNDASKVKTVASIGDKPLPIVAGEPGSSTTAETEQLDLSPPPGGRVSGRVFDDRGRPVPNARVRLVVGGAAGGRDNYATTDRSGAFTLRGLRAGRSYTLIAESQGDEGLMSGRAEARVSQTNVRIDVTAHDSGSEPRPKSIRPVRSRTESAPVPEVGDDDEYPPIIKPETVLPGEDEDKDQPAEEAASLSSNPGRRPAARLASTWSSTTIRAGWNTDLTSRSSEARRTVRPRGDDPKRSTTLDRDSDQDGENPLPPALEPGETAHEADFNRPRRREDGEPRPIPDDILEAGQGVAPASYGPTDPAEAGGGSDQPARASRSRRGPGGAAPATRRPRRTSEPADSTHSQESSDGVEPSSSSPIQRRPTWRELSISPGAVPLDESVRRTSIAATARDRDVVKLAVNRPSNDAMREANPGRRRRTSEPQPAAATGESTCQFDAAERRIVDFQLPDLAGKMVSFRDIDADIILVDFWGSWCLQCRKSIGYERDLQARLGGKRVQVIGIACEKGETLAERRASAARAARQLGINYPVLVSSMDGNCPLQKAFQVQFYPTIVLLDRSGRVLHVEQGATDATLGRTEHTIAAALEDVDRRVE